MTDRLTLQLEREARQAMDRLRDDLLSVEEFSELENRLTSDDAFRQAYVEQSALDSEIENQLRSYPEINLKEVRHASRKWSTALAIALSVLVLLGISNLLLIDQWKVALFGDPMLKFTETELIGQGPIAIVTNRSETSDSESPLRVGDRVKPGALRLNRGDLQLEFLSGVRVQLIGPAEIHLLSEHQATLLSGQAGVVTPPNAETFSLNGPVSAVANGPSEFVCRVTNDREDIDVFRGEVMASLLGPSGDTLVNELIASSHSASFAAGNLEVIAKDFSNVDRVDVLPVDDLYLNSTDRYAELVKADNPLLYWRFEDGDLLGDRVRNHMSDRYHGQIHSSDGHSIEVAQGRIEFSKSNKSRYLGISEPIEGINARDFSVEFWVRADRMHWGTFFGLLPVEQMDPTKESHLYMIEYANQTNVVHRPATIRTLFRYPPTTYEGGINVFSPNSCTPGVWTHVVAVRTLDSIRLYCNGELQFILDDLDFDDNASYEVVLGQLDSYRPMRQFEGQIDEVAIYTKALTEQQVRRHFETIAGTPQS